LTPQEKQYYEARKWAWEGRLRQDIAVFLLYDAGCIKWSTDGKIIRWDRALARAALERECISDYFVDRGLEALFDRLFESTACSTYQAIISHPALR
jgi:hypothetical protein